MSPNRIPILNSLLEFSDSIDQLRTAIGSLTWDSNRTAVTLEPRHLMRVLERYSGGELSALQVESWANLIEGREDIEVDDLLKDSLFELANPLLTADLSVDKAAFLLRRLSALTPKGDQGVSLLRRFWFEFQSSSRPTPINLGCGVTAYDYDDAIALMKELVFSDGSPPKILRVLEDVDVSQLDENHVIPNMGSVVSRGVWFPLV